MGTDYILEKICVSSIVGLNPFLFKAYIPIMYFIIMGKYFFACFNTIRHSSMYSMWMAGLKIQLQH